jgi:pimeloyl-ACP methyl ester carboxylesterase
VEGTRDVVRSADGTPIGILTGGSGPPLLLVHGGLSGLSRFAPLWRELAPYFRVTAMDRRGRGSSGDADVYAFQREFEDVRAVAEHLAGPGGEPIDAFGHSIGAVVVLGAAGAGAPLRRLALYEPPGPPTVSRGSLARMRNHVAAGQPGRAIASFLVDVVGMTPEQVEQARSAPPGPDDYLAIASRTFVREGEALAAVDLTALARRVRVPVLLMHGTASPPWTEQVVGSLVRALPDVEVVSLPGHGHEGVDTGPDLVAAELRRFLLRG